MLLNIWKKYSYIIVLSLLVLSLSITVLLKLDSNGDQYQQIKVEKGDTLWTIADKYSDHYTMTKEDFINWVGSENDLVSYQIKAGDSLTVPVKNIPAYKNTDYQLASE
ncbi:LysM repeat protein [Bacillus pakistanensis]|uniref:LysM repeat protein n=1 Tax=Rossellomorea pakistanensis TaxID=992288 RepID=A0ABS2NGI5_9BACI|nr:LysM peptidoglycan-binding domain-containing protein [Bacillus pakistanensis]MBM7586980.1 LysM repeat protein [Bacillus pakistanensis]